MKIYIQNGQYRFINYTDIKDKLEVGNYTLMKDAYGFYLQKSIENSIPEKIYGTLENQANKYIEKFRKINKNVGISLNGEKGSGKTLLSKLICEKIGLPAIIINTPYSGSDFVSFINDIEQEIVVLFDEFDKMYSNTKMDEDDLSLENHSDIQTDLLKIFDGGTKSKKLFLLTSNKSTLSDYMKNRPSRIRYKLEFSKMSKEFLKEVLEDKLLNKEYIDDFIYIYNKYFGFNLDTALILIDEVNMTGVKPSEAIVDMNISVENKRFDVSMYDGDKNKWETISLYNSPFDSEEIYIHFFRDIPLNKKQLKEAKEYGDINEYRRITYTINERTADFEVEQTSDGYILRHKVKNITLLFKIANLTA